MNVGKRWHLGDSCAPDNTTHVIDRIMLRFRPIAPKPTAGESASGGAEFDNKNQLLSKPRSKRKYVRIRKSSSERRQRRKSPVLEQICDDNIVTLQLLPDKDERDSSSLEPNQTVCVMKTEVSRESEGPSSWFRLMAVEPDLTPESSVLRVESWVTVESVTEPSGEAVIESRMTDVERVMNLEGDGCPGFVSDGMNRVAWVNVAFRKLILGGDAANGTSSPEITVWLVWKVEAPQWCMGFSCNVRLQYTWRRNKCLWAVPCDAWRMDGGGFAWRLDVEAALGLGRQGQEQFLTLR